MPQVLFRQILAKPVNWQPFYDEIATTLDKVVKPDMITWFNKIVSAWTHRPAFKAMKKITRADMSVYVYPTGPSAQIWRYVSQGTSGPYPIPKDGNTTAKMLRFRGNYKARTTTSGGYKGPGRATGKWYIRKRVTHPGIKARNFEAHIARWYKPTFTRTMKNAVARGLRKAQA
jgi:hypothetical protein